MPTAREVREGLVSIEDVQKRIRTKPGGCKCKKENCCKKKSVTQDKNTTF